MIWLIMPGGGHEQDVDLGMAPEPEKVLVEQGAAAQGGHEERRAEQAVELEQAGGQGDRGHREDGHEREHEHRPHEDRHPLQRHARAPAA